MDGLSNIENSKIRQVNTSVTQAVVASLLRKLFKKIPFSSVLTCFRACCCCGVEGGTK